jgi:SAM-dependent methyltransferase
MNADKHFNSWEDAISWLRTQSDQAQLVADCYYDDPLIAAAERYWNSEEWQAVRIMLCGRSGHALDVGAGRGIASYALARDGFAVSALEPDPSALVGAGAIRALAAESQLPIQAIEDFSERLPFADGVFDVIFCRAVLHHADDLEKTCRELFRVLKPGGLLVAIREHVISHTDDLSRFLEQHPLHRLYGGENAFLLRRYVTAIRQAGFTQLEVMSPWHSPVNFAPYTLDRLQNELARRFSMRIPAVYGLVRALLSLPGMWLLARNILASIDRRPGRLYSFVAERL